MCVGLGRNSEAKIAKSTAPQSMFKGARVRVMANAK